MIKNEFHKSLNVGNNSDLSNFRIFEQGTDVKLQFEFEKITNKIQKEKDFVIDNNDVIDILFDKETKVDYKKELLVKLAYSGEVESFRAIEKFATTAETELEQWVTLALQRSQAMLETSLSSSETIFIATGLGGVGKKLRYFFILQLKEDKEFSDFQKEIIIKEINYAFEINNGIAEEFNFKDNYVSTMCLVPLNISLDKIFRAIIGNINTFGGFLSENVIATNAQKYSHDEIIKIINGKFDEELDDEDIFDVDDYKDFF